MINRNGLTCLAIKTYLYCSLKSKTKSVRDRMYQSRSKSISLQAGNFFPPNLIMANSLSPDSAPLSHDSYQPQRAKATMWFP